MSGTTISLNHSLVCSFNVYLQPAFTNTKEMRIMMTRDFTKYITCILFNDKLILNAYHVQAKRPWRQRTKRGPDPEHRGHGRVFNSLKTRRLNFFKSKKWVTTESGLLQAGSGWGSLLNSTLPLWLCACCLCPTPITCIWCHCLGVQPSWQSSSRALSTD